jgi:hypothetical protein
MSKCKSIFTHVSGRPKKGMLPNLRCKHVSELFGLFIHEFDNRLEHASTQQLPCGMERVCDVLGTRTQARFEFHRERQKKKARQPKAKVVAIAHKRNQARLDTLSKKRRKKRAPRRPKDLTNRPSLERVRLAELCLK